MQPERTAGPLGISKTLRKALAMYRCRHSITAPAALSVTSVQNVENQIGRRLPDELWAYLASAGCEPFQVLMCTTDALEHDSFRSDYIAFERDGGHRSYFCVDRRYLGDKELVIREWSPVHPGGDRWASLAQFVLWRAEPTLGEVNLNDTTWAAKLSGAEFGPNEPGLVEVADSQVEQRVRHARFGEGVVRRRIPGPVAKLVIDFGEHGQKTILASYVTEVDDGDGPDKNAAEPGTSALQLSLGPGEPSWNSRTA